MPIPDFESIMLPLLRSLKDGRERSTDESVEAIPDEFHLTPEEREQLLPSGRQAIIVNRIAWAKVYLKKAGLLESIKAWILPYY